MVKHKTPPFQFSPVQFITGFLILLAIVLGVAIFKQNGLKIPNLSSISSTKNIIPSPTNPPIASSSGQRRPLPESLTDDERALLNPPAPDASKEEKDKHYALAVKLAQTASYLDINNCNKPNPLAMKLKSDTNFIAKNNDSVDHTIVIDQNHHYTVPASGSTTIKVDFGHGLGVYGYLCDNIPGVVGFFLVTP